MRTPGVALLMGLCLGLSLSAAPFGALAAPPVAASAAQPSDVEPEAVQALQRMSAYLGTLSSFEIKAETTLDLVTDDDQTLQLDGVTHYKVHRPDGFTIDVASDRMRRQFIYDGKQLTVYAPELRYYATVPAPPTIRETLDAAWKKYGISLPLEDLFRWSDPNSSRPDDLTSGYRVGTATIDGVATDHYAFREGAIDWQIWIQKGERPIPRKLVIIDRTDTAHPAYIARLSWNVSPTLTAQDFTFRPAKDAMAIRLAEAGK